MIYSLEEVNVSVLSYHTEFISLVKQLPSYALYPEKESTELHSVASQGIKDAFVPVMDNFGPSL